MLDKIRNTVLLSHSGAGKTSLAEAMLFNAKAVTRLGKVEDGSTASDYDPTETKRQISIQLSLLPCSWQDNKINVLDAPGYTDFVGEVKAGEGVFGLRRAFEVAGVDTLIMSLWSVEDEATREWMKNLYEVRFVEGKDTAESVREASLRVLKRRREEGEEISSFSVLSAKVQYGSAKQR